LAGTGTERDVTLFYCFVMDAIPDDMNGIFESLKEAALTMQQGGDIGYDFSTLRSEKAAMKIVCHLQRGIESVRECHYSPVNR
jgi:ribonucleoside-diphosphate reductase alpha chain